MRPRPSKRSVIVAFVRGYLTTMLAIATVSGLANAQDRTLFNSDQIPRELVVALMSYDGSSLPDIIIGKIPPLLAGKLVVPPRARVLGSQMSPSQTVVVIDTPIAAEAVRPLVDTGLVQLGWKRGPTPVYSGGGFRPASSRTPYAYCRAAQSVSFSLIPQGIDASLLRYSIMDDDSRCTINFQHVAPMSFEFPTLVDPPGSDRSTPACRALQMPASGPTASAALSNALALEELLAAYGKQLTDSGWIAAPAPTGDKAVERMWRQTRTGAGSRYAVVKVTQPAAHPECRIMEMRLMLDYSR